ncbi:Junctophilin-2 [Dissostichus eleginoides]|uniref:Junctophilin-2 n=1 Tax=Dissostichus eleginoides TaxID=100907 RepID=A0AAD9FE24_DISEL|nr:Junctophilin-2 [Dissostichus eleginoides]
MHQLNNNRLLVTTHSKGKADGAELAALASNSESSIARLVSKELSPSFYQPGPEYLKKRVIHESIEGSETTETIMHEPLLAEEEPLPTPPESPLMNELDNLMPGSSPARTPSPSPGIISKEDPKLLSPGSWNEDKSIKNGGSKGSSKSNSRPSSRPTTPATSAPPSAAPESTEAPGSRGPSRTPSRQSSKNEQGSDLEIKPLQKFDSEEPAPDVVFAPVASCHHKPPPPSLKPSRSYLKELHQSRNERPPTPVEAKAIVAKPAAKVEPKAESRQKAMALSRSPDVPAESLELEGPNTIMICMVILLNIGLAILFVHILS